MLIEQIEMICTQPLERAFDDEFYVISLLFRPGSRRPVSRSIFQPNFEVIVTFGRAVRPRRGSSFSKGPYASAGIKQCNAAVMGGAENADPFRPVWHGRLVSPMHAQTESRDLQIA